MIEQVLAHADASQLAMSNTVAHDDSQNGFAAGSETVDLIFGVHSRRHDQSEQSVGN